MIFWQISALHLESINVKFLFIRKTKRNLRNFKEMLFPIRRRFRLENKKKKSLVSYFQYLNC